MRKSTTPAWLSLLLLAAGCAHYPVNKPLPAAAAAPSYRFKTLSADGNSDKLFLILTFSGGGTRAAAFSYGVLAALRDAKILIDGKERRLLDEVDVISSISGGSFTAGYYALFGDRIFADFETKFLKRDIQGELKRLMFLPKNWFRLASSTFDRIDMAAEHYDQTVFQGKTYADLLRNPRRPFVIINATDMSLGGRFEFTQDQFDLLHSDLSPFPVARAVAASSAFPFLLSPVTVRNYPRGPAFAEPAWIASALEERDIPSRRYQEARSLATYRDAARRPYVHLLDGGLSDNIGLRGPLGALATTDSPWSLLRMINAGKVQRVAVIVVNAKTEAPDRFQGDAKEGAPGLKSTAMLVATGPMDAYSFETTELLRKTVEEINEGARSLAHCRDLVRAECPQAGAGLKPLPPVEFYPIELNFDMVEDPAERKFFKELPTTFALPGATVEKLRDLGPALLRKSEVFHDLERGLR